MLIGGVRGGDGDDYRPAADRVGLAVRCGRRRAVGRGGGAAERGGQYRRGPTGGAVRFRLLLGFGDILRGRSWKMEQRACQAGSSGPPRRACRHGVTRGRWNACTVCAAPLNKYSVACVEGWESEVTLELDVSLLLLADDGGQEVNLLVELGERGHFIWRGGRSRSLTI